jgi:hypothetical protein
VGVGFAPVACDELCPQAVSKTKPNRSRPRERRKEMTWERIWL